MTLVNYLQMQPMLCRNPPLAGGSAWRHRAFHHSGHQSVACLRVCMIPYMHPMLTLGGSDSAGN